MLRRFVTMRRKHEAHLSAEDKKNEKKAWIPFSFGHKSGKENPGKKKKKGTETPYGLSGVLVKNRCINVRSLSGKRNFAEVFQKGKKIFFGSGYIVFLASANDDQENIYVGITVRKKLGNAVERNRAKRVIRETFRNVIRAEEMKRPFAIIFVLNKVDIDSTEIKKAIVRVLSNISRHSGEKAN